MKRSAHRACGYLLVAIAILLSTTTRSNGDEPGLLEPLERSFVGLAASPFELDKPMRSWLRRAVDPAEDDLEQLYALDRSINGVGGLNDLSLAEIEDWSGSAREVFDRGEADCVGYAFLFLTFADALGLDVDFAIEAKPDRLEIRPGVRIVRRHLAVVHLESSTVWDFSGARPFDPALHEKVSRDTGRAILDSNRGMQTLLSGDPSTAVEILRRAVRWDSSLPFVWSNLAVAIRRSESAARRAESDIVALPDRSAGR